MRNNFGSISRTVLVLSGMLLANVCFLLAQGDTASQAIGLPMHGSFSGSNLDNVQLNNGNLHIEIPLYSIAGRGLSVPVSFVYDSKGWCEYTTNFVLGTPVNVYPRPCPGKSVTVASPAQNMKWTVAAPLANGLGRGLATSSFSCTAGQITLDSVSYREPNGTSHDFLQTSAPGNVCNYYSPSYEPANDGSGYALVNGQIVAKDGTRVYGTVDGSAWVMEDTNGNQITRAVSNGVGASTITDTLGRSFGIVLVLNSGTGKYELKYYDSTGTQRTIQFTMTTVNVHTNLCPYQTTGSDGPCTEWVGSWQAPSVIQLPNGMQYNISYIQNSHGQISSIQVPTGATISYTWGTGLGNVDDAGPKVMSRTVTSSGQVSVWNYGYAGSVQTGTTTVTDPLLNDTVHTFQRFAGDGFHPNYDIKDQFYQGPASSNVQLKTVDTVYQSTVGPLHLPISVTTTWNQQGGLMSREETDYYVYQPISTIYQSWGNVTEKREFPFGTGGTWGALARKTDYQYAHISGNTNYNVNYTNLGIANRVTQKTVWDGPSNSVVSDSKTVYDGTAVTTTTSVPNHDYTIGTYRGNPTQSSVWLDTTSTWLSTTNTYNDLGGVLSTKDPGLHTITFSFADSWASGAATCGVGTNTQAFLTETDAPDTTNSQSATVHHRSQNSYYPCTGQKQSVRNENDILATRTGTTFTYDLMLRPLTVTKTNGGQTSYSYTDTSGAVSVTTTEKQDASHNVVNTAYHDGIGRVKQTRLVDPNEGDVFVDTTYDLSGRVASVSNPYRSASATTDGTTTYQYDTLDRKILEIPPDGSSTANNVQTAYGAQSSGVLGLTTTITDQAGHKRMSVTDALGRLVDVWEPDPTSGSLVNETLYTYNALDNLLRVDQKGGSSNSANWRTRTFTYDSLSRLLTATNPESGLITWTYDTDSNVLTKKDARNVTITYNHDQLHRVATVGTAHAKSYSNGDAAVDYFYDQTSYNGLTIAEGVGQQTGMADGTGKDAITFDTQGRALTDSRTINITGLTPSGVNEVIKYAYNLDGSMQSLSYPNSHRVTYLYDQGGHALSAIDSSTSTNVIKYVTSATYAPHGDVASYVNGLTSSFTGITTTNTWNNRFQPTTFTAATQGSGGGTVMSLAFSFNQGTGGATIDNGLLVKINNNVNTGRNVNYAYDQLNRITAGWHDTTDWGTQYTVDIWGTLTQKAPCNGTGVCPTRAMGNSFSASANANNQFNTYSYDASGNLLNDQLTHAFAYDAENRPKTAGGVTYYYDGAGKRVAKSNGKLYFFGTGSTPAVETDTTGAITSEYVFFGGKRVAMRLADGTVHYYFADQIGSANVMTNATGVMPPEQDIEYHPYGEEQVYAGTLGQQYRFTGQEHDAETNDDYFGAREYSSTMGRFLTPDWSATPEPIPYAVMGNPQTLNLYTYVENNPITGTDPDGHWGCGGEVLCSGMGTPSDPKEVKEDLEKQNPAQHPAQNAINTKPSQPLPPPMAQLKTDMNGHTTSLLATDKRDELTVTTIETRNDLAGSPKVKAGAGDPYTTHDIVGVSNRHAGQDAYGPAGAFIDTGDSRGRDIHGGGTGLPDPMAPQQGWKPTFGCTRGQNEDVIKLGNAITQFQQSNPNVVIPYVRE